MTGFLKCLNPVVKTWQTNNFKYKHRKAAIL